MNFPNSTAMGGGTDSAFVGSEVYTVFRALYKKKFHKIMKEKNACGHFDII